MKSEKLTRSKGVSRLALILFLLAFFSPVVLEAEEWHTVKLQNSYATDLELVADELGFFKEKKVKAEFIGVLPNGTTSAAALASGIVDAISYSHTDYVVLGRMAGAKIKLIGMSADATKDYPHMEFYVLKDSPIKNARDIVGKRIGGLTGRAEGIQINGCSGYSTAEYLNAVGINVYSAKIEGVFLQTPQMLQALKQGQIDIATFHPPLTGLASRTPGLRKLYDDWETLHQFYGKGATRALTASDRWIKRDPEGVRAYLAAMALAADWCLAHEEESKWIFNKRLDLNLKTPEEIRNLDVFRWMPEQGISEKEDVQVWLDLMVKYKVIKAPAPVASDFYTTEFNTYSTLLKSKKITTADILKEAEAIANRNYPTYINKSVLLDKGKGVIHAKI